MYDEKTGEASLGETAAEANRQSEQKANNAALSKMLDLLTRNPEMEHKDLLNSLSGSSRSKNVLIRESVLNRLIIKSGKGVKGSPLKYRIADVPIEVAVPKGGEEIAIQSHDSTDPNSSKGTQK